MSPVEEKLNITFSGCGFLGIYHVGVLACLQTHAPALLQSLNKYGGASAGALSACSLLFNSEMEVGVRFVMKLADMARVPALGPISSSFDPSSFIRRTFTRSLPGNAYQIASGRLYVSMTRVSDMSSYIVSNFTSNKDLIDALICSSFVPLYSGIIPPKFRGVSYMDGGFTDNLPQHFDGTTITVSPFSGESDICPDDSNTNLFHYDLKNTSIQFTSHNLYRLSRAFFPPDTEVLCEMSRQGFRDSLKYLHLHYPHLLSINIERIRMPDCCYEQSGEDDNVSLFSCDSDSACDVESAIAERHAIVTGVKPHELNQVLLANGEKLAQSEEWALYIMRILMRLLKWMARPAMKCADNVGFVIHQTIKWLLPKLGKLTSHNRYSAGAVSLCMEVCRTYKGWYQHERHPSLNDEVFIDIQEASDRIKLVQSHMKAVPIRCNSVSQSSSDSEPAFEGHKCSAAAASKAVPKQRFFTDMETTFSPNIEEYIQHCKHLELSLHGKAIHDSYDEFVSDFLEVDAQQSDP